MTPHGLFANYAARALPSTLTLSRAVQPAAAAATARRDHASSHADRLPGWGKGEGEGEAQGEGESVRARVRVRVRAKARARARARERARVRR